ncbi:hypothetical protein MGN01_35300 [Methylobacterium gnaphalii]|uniref:Uncharacterized protein n=1 Tax=Methylobacterium gnaphalii TaxID=1010610 RepID=A0A512JP01_9HYPH|nr:hypothetical protein MGN01_35300 [Methylobacterium gnaphalii]GLS50183.1 hypothetical protein GCM10007885_30350 [Methylobacterium gnaphalii]
MIQRRAKRLGTQNESATAALVSGADARQMDRTRARKRLQALIRAGVVWYGEGKGRDPKASAVQGGTHEAFALAGLGSAEVARRYAGAHGAHRRMASTAAGAVRMKAQRASSIRERVWPDAIIGGSPASE